MGIILETLKRLGKSTSLGLAKASAVEPREVISTLLRLENTGRVSQCNGFWSCSSGKGSTPARRGGTIEKISLPQLVKLVDCLGPITARELAEKANASPKAVSTSLCNAFREGRLSRSGNRSAYVYAKKLTLQKDPAND